MMTLIALAITTAFVYSSAVAVGFPGMPLWEELATLVTIMLLGHWIEMRSIAGAQGALSELAKLLPDVATRIIEGTGAERLDEVPVASLSEGDLVLIRPGASIPADGEHCIASALAPTTRVAQVVRGPNRDRVGRHISWRLRRWCQVPPGWRSCAA